MNMSEQAAVGSILIDPAALRPLREEVSADDFENTSCRKIFETACRLQDAGEPLNAATIAGKLDDISQQFLKDLMDFTPTACAVREYGRDVHRAAARRKIRAVGMRMADLGAEEDPYEAINAAQTQLESLAKVGSLVSPLDQMHAFHYRLAAISFDGIKAVVPTGIGPLDEVLGGGMVHGGMYVLAARPGVGKTNVALHIADNIAKSGLGVLYCSLEMTAYDITARRMGHASGLAVQLFTHNGLPDQNGWDKCIVAEDHLSRLPFYTVDRPQMTLAEIEMLARRIENPGCVVIDYIGLLKQGAGKSLYEKMTAVSNGVKRMAMALNVPVLALCQLNRESEHAGTRPKMSELRDTGAIEQDADGIILLSTLRRDTDALGKTVLRAEVAKNRHGAVGEVQLLTYGINGYLLDLPRDEYIGA